LCEVVLSLTQPTSGASQHLEVGSVRWPIPATAHVIPEAFDEILARELHGHLAC
jgi:hypothetical protein